MIKHLFFKFQTKNISAFKIRGILRGILANVLDCDIKVNGSELQSRYNLHFRINTFGKGMNPLIFLRNGLNSTTTVLLQEWLEHKITGEYWYSIKVWNKQIVSDRKIMLELMIEFDFYIQNVNALRMILL